jgi:hypothetical protein
LIFDTGWLFFRLTLVAFLLTVFVLFDPYDGASLSHQAEVLSQVIASIRGLAVSILSYSIGIDLIAKYSGVFFL